jgi:drug/metabolite transporter (DMT)-like permease
LRHRKVDIFYIPPECRKGILARFFFGAISNITLYGALKNLSMSKATLLFWTQPMFVGLFGFLILKERFTKFDVLGIFFVFTGVIMVSNPFEEN